MSYYQQNYHSVADHGARGDGRQDDAPAVAAAIRTALEENPENTVYFPAGTYRVASPVVFPASLDVVFEDGACLLIDADTAVEWHSHLEAGLHPVFTGAGTVEGHLNNPCTYPQWYGAAGDGKTDDTAAFAAALRNSGALAVPYRAAGYVLGSLYLKAAKAIYGCDEQPAKLIGAPSCAQLFVLQAPSIKISHLMLDMSRTGESTCFYFDIQPGQPLSDEKVADIVTEGAYHVVTDSRRDKRTDKVYITNTVLDGLTCRNNRQTAIRTRNFWGFIFMRNILLDNSALQTTDGNYPAFELEDNEGGILQNIRIIGTGKPENSCEVGFLYTCDVATWMDHCRAENLGGDGLRIRNTGFHLYFSDVAFVGNRGHGMVLEDCLYPQIHKVTVQSGPDAGPDRCGIFGDKLVDAQLNEITVRGLPGGVVLRNSHHNVVTGVQTDAAVPCREEENCRLNIMLCNQ
ncbi:MAG: hypothetical protein IKI50_03890 [Clostridia bacterium]|nr:hypothetical protein [Clostridia bacterium]